MQYSRLDVPWQSLLPQLGIHPVGRSLPTTADCPCCGNGRWTLYYDSALFGIWYNCKTCGAHGNIIDLIGSVRNTDPATSLRWALQHHVKLPADIKESQWLADTARHTAQQRIFDVLLKRASDRLYATSLPLFDDLVPMQVPLAMVNRMLPTIGSMDYSNVMQGLTASEFALPTQHKPCLVVPLHDMPNRLAGLVVARKTRGRIFTELFTIGHRAAAEGTDCGVCGLPWLLDIPVEPEFGAAVIIMPVFEAFRWQILHGRHNPDTVVPVVGAPLGMDNQHKRPCTCVNLWRNWMPDSRPVFAFDNKNRAICHSARHASMYGKLASQPLPIHGLPPIATLLQTVKNGETFLDVTANAILQAPDGGLDDVLEQHAVARWELGTLLADHKYGQRIMARLHGTRTCHIAGRLVEEHNGNWMFPHVYTQSPHVSDTTLTIETIVGEDDDRYCLGQLCQQGKQAAFSAKLLALRDDTRNWLRRACAELQWQTPRIKTYWDVHLYDIATAMYPPRVVPYEPQYGWRPHAQEFCLPRVRLARYRPPEDLVSVCGKQDIVPASHVTSVHCCNAQPAIFTDATRFHPSLWAAAAATAASVVAPAIGYRRQHTAFTGSSAGTLHTLATAWGFVPFVAGGPATIYDSDKLLAMATIADWPFALRLSVERCLEDLLAVLSSGKRVVSTAFWTSPRYLQAMYHTVRYQVVDIPVATSLDYGEQMKLTTVLFSWLADLGSRGYALPGDTLEPLARRVLDDMGNWAARLQGNKTFILEGKKFLPENSNDVHRRTEGHVPGGTGVVRVDRVADCLA